MFKPTLATILTLLAAAPVFAGEPHREFHHVGKHPVSKRGNSPGVYICTGKNWSGSCSWEDPANGYCHNYWLGPDTSFGPDQGVRCTVHPQINCKGDNYAAKYPGVTALGFEGMSWSCKTA